MSAEDIEEEIETGNLRLKFFVTPPPLARRASREAKIADQRSAHANAASAEAPPPYVFFFKKT
jgi:hypothetical protein